MIKGRRFRNSFWMFSENVLLEMRASMRCLGVFGHTRSLQARSRHEVHSAQRQSIRHGERRPPNVGSTTSVRENI